MSPKRSSSWHPAHNRHFRLPKFPLEDLRRYNRNGLRFTIEEKDVDDSQLHTEEQVSSF
jgi:hypothetical protein